MDLNEDVQSVGSKYVKIYLDKVIRKVDNLKEVEVILDAAKKNPDIYKSIIDTEIYSVEEKLLKHRKIKHIIHSGEYTVSMAYDVTKLALDMALYFIDYGIYSYDLLPHNFTFENGKWILYDFGAMKITPEQVKTQIRSIFKISFSAFELANVIGRSELKHYYLNRIKLYDLVKMIPLIRWLKYTINLRLTQLLCSFKLYKQAYSLLKYFYNQYEQKHKFNIYNYKSADNYINLFSIINKYLEETNSNDIFCIGKFGADWAINSNKDLSKFVYFDDYELCDEYYNYIKNSPIANISAAVLYPFMTDDEIPQNLNYRAIYDYFAQERFLSDSVILDLDELIGSTNLDIETFCSNISEFALKNIIIKTENAVYIEELQQCLLKDFENIDIKKIEQFTLIIGTNKKAKQTTPPFKKEYANCNRMSEANIQSTKIMQILKTQNKLNKFEA